MRIRTAITHDLVTRQRHRWGARALAALLLILWLIPQGFAAAEMRVIERVTTRAAQRTFASDFNGKRGVFAFKDFSPGLNNLRGLHL